MRRLSGKAPKSRHIEIFLHFGNAAGQDASAHKNVNLFLREPLGGIAIVRWHGRSDGVGFGTHFFKIDGD